LQYENPTFCQAGVDKGCYFSVILSNAKDLVSALRFFESSMNFKDSSAKCKNDRFFVENLDKKSKRFFRCRPGKIPFDILKLSQNHRLLKVYALTLLKSSTFYSQQ